MQRMRVKILAVIGLFLLINCMNLNAQAKDVILLEGMLTEASSREPIQTDVYFIDESGKKIPAKSEINGKFQVVLKSSKKYVMTAKDFLIDEAEALVEMPKVKEYTEIFKNFKANRIYKGMQLLSVYAFGSNQASVNADALNEIMKVQAILEQNNKLKLEVIISTKDTYKKPTSKKISEPNPNNPKKKITKKVTISCEEQLQELLAQRISNVRDILTVMKIRDNRYFVTEELVCGELPKKKSKPKKGKKSEIESEEIPIKTLTVKVSEIMNL